MLYSTDKLKALFTFPSVPNRVISQQNGRHSELLRTWNNAVDAFETAAQPMLVDNSIEGTDVFLGTLVPAAVSEIECPRWNVASLRTECGTGSPHGGRCGGCQYS